MNIKFLKYKNFLLNKIKFSILIGDWGLGVGPNPQSPIPHPQSPNPNQNKKIYCI